MEFWQFSPPFLTAYLEKFRAFISSLPNRCVLAAMLIAPGGKSLA